MAAAEAAATVTEAAGRSEIGKGAWLRVYYVPDDLADYRDLVDLFSGWIGGKVNHKEVWRCDKTAFEKTIRTSTNYGLHKHVSAWQSRHPTEMKGRYQFGGAVILDCLIPELRRERVKVLIAVSGFREVDDEAFTLILPMMPRLNWQPTNASVYQILHLSGNQAARTLVDKVLGPDDGLNFRDGVETGPRDPYK
jgi:hypothetical protein